MLLLRVQQLASAGDVQGACEQALAVRSSHPQSTAAAYMHGALSLQLGELEEALPSLEFVIRVDPSNWHAATNLSTCLLQCDRAAEAVNAARLLIGMQPNFIAGRVILAQALRATGALREALAEARKALKLKEDMVPQPTESAYDPPLFIVAELLVDVGELKEAWELAIRGAEVAQHGGPQMVLACTIAGRVQEANGQYEQALAAFEKATKLDPSKPRANSLRTGMITKALRACLPALPGAPCAAAAAAPCTAAAASTAPAAPAAARSLFLSCSSTVADAEHSHGLS